MGIEDSEVWDYSTAIRDIIETKELRHLKTLRIIDLLNHEGTGKLTREEYLVHASCYRRELIAKYGPRDFNSRDAIRNDNDTCMTYRGYIKFLTKDLMYSKISAVTQSQTKGKKQYKEAIERIALQMIERGRVSLQVHSVKQS